MLSTLGRRKEIPATLGTSKRLAPLYDRYSQHSAIREAARSGPLQSLTKRELALDAQPLTIYPQSHQKVLAWVRFGSEAIRVEAELLRSTPLAAGIQFTAHEQTFRCWVWGNAVTPAED